MAKQRYVNTKFWDDDYICSLNAHEKLVFLYFLTNTLTNICGIYEISLRRIVFDTRIETPEILKILKKFENDGKMAFRAGWIAIKNHIKHQRQNNSKIGKAIQEGIEIAPIDMKKWVFGEIKMLPVCHTDITSISHPYHIEVSSHLDRDLNSDLDVNSVSPETGKSDQEIDLFPEPSKPSQPITKSSPKKPEDPDKDLKQKIEQSFKAVSGDFASYEKERSSIKRIVRAARIDCPDDTENYIRAMLEKFKELTESNDKFYSKIEFSPSKLIGCWMNIRKLLKNDCDREMSPEMEAMLDRALRS